MRYIRRYGHRLLHRGAGLVVLALLASGSGLVTAPGTTGGGGGGTGDITDVFSCSTGDCNVVVVQDGESLTATGTGVIAATTAANLAANPADCPANQYATTIGANGNLTCAQVATSQLTGTITDAQLANNYSGVGACAANTWASTLNDNAAPTCTQPAFSNLSGSASDAQIPDSITVSLAATATALATDPTACAADRFVTDMAASGTLTCTQPTIQNLVNFSSSELAGELTDETGTAGNAVFSASPTFTGNITVSGDGARLTFDPDSTNTQTFIQFTDGTETITGINTGIQVPSGTYTLNSNLSGFLGFSVGTSAIFSYTAGTSPIFSLSNLFNAASKIQIASGAAVSGVWATPYVANHTFEASGAGTVATLNAPGADYTSTPTFNAVSSGAFGTSDRYGFYHKPTVGTGVTQIIDRAVYIGAKAGAGTLNYAIGIDIEALTGTNIFGIRNASTTIYQSPCTGDPGAGFTITSTPTMCAMTPSGGARTSSVTTAILDGYSSGQLLYIMNTGTANTLTIKNGANTDFGAADCVLNRGGMLQVMWDGVDSNWLQVSCSPN